MGQQSRKGAADFVPTRRTSLQVALCAVGVIMLLVYPLMRFWPGGWTSQPGQHEYEQMIAGIYATLGIFLLVAARNPENHTSLIWFTIWSSVVHGAIMTIQAALDPSEHGHLLGDVPALFLAALVLGLLAPRKGRRHAV
jgi:hypothetical protein